MTDAELARRAVEVSGLAARRFAVELLGTNERTVRRWLAGDSAIRDPADRAWLERFVAVLEDAPARRTG